MDVLFSERLTLMVTPPEVNVDDVSFHGTEKVNRVVEQLQPKKVKAPGPTRILNATCG